MTTFPKNPFSQITYIEKALQAAAQPPKWWRDYIAMEEGLAAHGRKLSSQVAALFRQFDDSTAAASARLAAADAGCTAVSSELTAAVDAIAASWAAVCKPLTNPLTIPDLTPRWQLPEALLQVTPREPQPPPTPRKRKIGFS